jgi:hypothetical protein
MPGRAVRRRDVNERNAEAKASRARLDGYSPIASAHATRVTANAEH